MARQARGEYLNPDEIQVVHAVQRCVRQAFLCGLDKNSGNNRNRGQAATTETGDRRRALC